MRKKTYSHVTKDKDGIIRAYYKHTGGYHEIDKTETMTNIKEINLSTGKWLAITVPIRSGDYEIRHNVLMYADDLSAQHLSWQNERLPIDNTYTLIGKASELQWNDKVKIVESENDGSNSLRSWWYKIYDPSSWKSMTKDANESFDTLMAVNNINPETTIIIQQQ